MKCVVCELVLEPDDPFVVLPVGPEDIGKLKRQSAFPPGAKKQWLYHVVATGSQDGKS